MKKITDKQRLNWLLKHELSFWDETKFDIVNLETRREIDAEIRRQRKGGA